uniref:Uncharacterized protein n=1 Tax=Rhizophora mucronata TaxID=61149 RepID=A0A2P2LZP6_RHIMU
MQVQMTNLDRARCNKHSTNSSANDTTIRTGKGDTQSSGSIARATTACKQIRACQT